MTEEGLLSFPPPPWSQTPPWPFTQTSVRLPTFVFLKSVASHLLSLSLKSPTAGPSQHPRSQGLSPHTALSHTSA